MLINLNYINSNFIFYERIIILNNYNNYIKNILNKIKSNNIQYVYNITKILFK